VSHASGLTNQQGGAMGEGWGDFFAVCMTSQASHNFATGVFPIGGWTDLLAGFNDNYYFSIRRYPYSADMAKNPLTFQHISANVLLPVGPPRNPLSGGGSNNEEHNAGEVWCCPLWEVFVNLVAEYGHEEAEKRMLIYVIGGLKLTPSQPTPTLARDGIIAAVSGLNPSDLSRLERFRQARNGAERGLAVHLGRPRWRGRGFHRVRHRAWGPQPAALIASSGVFAEVSDEACSVSDRSGRTRQGAIPLRPRNGCRLGPVRRRGGGVCRRRRLERAGRARR
jgi:Fungalysin metallopeptidase (M36)